jgi:ABC-2 type transport system permease protein
MSSAARDQFGLLLQNEWLQYLRSGAVKGTSLAFLVVSQVLLHLIALLVAFAVNAPPAGAARGAIDPQAMLAGGMLAMLLLMSSRSLAGMVQSFYTRGDLDLLLASPVDRRAIIAVRVGTIALTVAMEVALLVFPFANVFVLFGMFGWFKAYLLVPTFAMLATSIGLAVTLLAFRTLGPRRTRVAVQVFAVLMGVGMMLAIYLPGMLQGDRSAPPMSTGMNLMARRGGYFAQAFGVPAGWVMHGYLPTLAMFAGATALLAFCIHLAGEPLVRTLTGVTVGGRRRRGAATSSIRFRGGFRAVVVWKELKLIARDPFLIAQILQQSLYVLPMAFVLWRARFGSDLPLAWLAVVMLAAGIAGPLSWLTVVAEDAPDLLGSAPVTRAALIRAKIEAALLPTLPICAAPLLFLAATRPWFGACTSLCAFGAALCNALINMRNPVARRRDTFRTRHRGGGGNGLLEVLSMFLWLALCFVLVLVGRELGWR